MTHARTEKGWGTQPSGVLPAFEDGLTNLLEYDFRRPLPCRA